MWLKVQNALENNIFSCRNLIYFYGNKDVEESQALRVFKVKS